MRKHFTLLAVILLIALSLQVFAGCSNGSGNGDTTTTTTVTSTTTTISATTTTTKKDDGSGDSTPDTQTTKDEGDLKDPITTTSPDEGQPDDPIIPGTTQGSDTNDNPDIPATTTTKKQENQDPDTDDQPATADGVDLVLFIGQSNMAGRGSSTKATVVEESHAYEFRAISDPTKLYPVKEPFGATENNSASGVTESKKTGSLVSAFCESYYAATGTPIVAVSCSKGGEKISFFDTSTKVYADAVSRMKAAKAYLDGEYAKGNTQFKVKNVYVVWLQGESDADNNTSTSAYTAALSRIVAGFKKDIGCDQTFVIPIGTYNGNDGALKAKYNTIRDTQILFCQDNPDATVICTQLADLHRFGYMKDQYHFHQEGYEIIGKDAGANMAFFTENGKKPVCQPYFEEENAVRENGAWQEENGKVVIPASAAAERSNYANFSSSGENYSFAAVSGTLEGIKNTNANGKYWDNITYAFFSAPSVHYTVNFKTAGRYYIYLLTSYPDTGSNSVYVNIDDGELVTCANNSFGSGKWMSDQTWYLDITEPGEHTVNVYVREDGIILNQIVLSKSSTESFTAGTPEKVSKRNTYTQSGIFVEVNGTVSIDLSTAFENSNYAYHTSGSANTRNETFIWERSKGYDGVQVFPNVGVQWGTNNISPKLSYVVDFSTAGDYYVSLRTSHDSSSSDSVFISVNNGSILALNNFFSTGGGKWLADSTWKITIPYPGVHTINIFAREDGAILNQMYLTKEPVLCDDPASDQRTDISNSGKYVADGGYTIVSSEGEKTEFTVTFPASATYLMYVRANAVKGGKITLKSGKTSTYTYTESTSGWVKAFEHKASSAGSVTFTLEADEGVEAVYLCLVEKEEEEKLTSGIETLVLGDSYTSLTAWRYFEEQTDAIGGTSIGIGGTKVADWVGDLKYLPIYDPKNIVVHIGVNDIDGGISGTDCGNSIVALLTSLKEMFPNSKIFYVSICDNDKFPDKWADYATSNGIVKSFADKTDGIYYVDFATPFKTACKEMANNGFRDQLHISFEAYVMFSQIVVDAVLEANKD